jgi:hypothetical protein
VDVVRVSPQARNTLDILQAFDGVLKGTRSAAQAQQDVAARLPGEACNGYWYGKPGLDQHAATSQPTDAQTFVAQAELA